MPRHTALITAAGALTAWGLHTAYLARQLRQSRRDPLTNLPRRDLFTRQARRLLHQTPEAAVLLLDLDGFKEVNDTLGHEVGDIVLAVTADRLQQALPAAALARLGGDEFAAVAAHPPDCAALAETLATPVLHPHGVATPGVSLGVATGPHNGLSDALQHADAAMYAAKTTGSGTATFDPRRHRPAQGRQSHARVT